MKFGQLPAPHDHASRTLQRPAPVPRRELFPRRRPRVGRPQPQPTGAVRDYPGGGSECRTVGDHAVSGSQHSSASHAVCLTARCAANNHVRSHGDTTATGAAGHPTTTCHDDDAAPGHIRTAGADQRDQRTQ